MARPSPWVPRIESVRRLVRPVGPDPTGARGPTRAQARGAGWRRTSRGWYVPAEVDADEPGQRVIESAVLLPPGGVVTGWGALWLARASYFDGLGGDGLTQRPVPLLLPTQQSRRPRDGVRWLRDRLTSEETWVRFGVPCARPDRALFDEARRQADVRAAVVDLDMAYAAELTSRRRTRRDLDGRAEWDGVPLVRRAWELADENSWSPGESRTRLVWVLDARRPRPQTNRPVFGADGQLLGIADLLDDEAGVAGEYDGAEHARPGRRSRDAAKESRFRDHGLEVVRITAYDEHVPGQVAERIDAAYQRAARNRLPRRWTATPPRGAEPSLTLDERLELIDVMRDLHQRVG